VIFAEVVRQLETGLRAGLPGAAAHLRLAPVVRREWPAGFNPARVRHAAGLLLVFPKTINAKPAELAKQRNSLRPLRSTSTDAAHIVLTVRAGTLERHRGQVSLPGGVVEPGETFEQAALREAHEEVGLSPAGVRLVGPLTAIDIPVSGFRLHPIVGVVATRPQLAPSDGEVARILEVDLDDLVNPARFGSIERERDGLVQAFPAFLVGGSEIWGATAMVLAEFLALLGWPIDERR
jgi:8-oxo-dGTP pyrophosphatase MutT (NUDIX family)